MAPRPPLWVPLSMLLAGSGVLHFVKPEPYASIVPRQLGDPLPWVYASGIAEFACATGLAFVRTRRQAALATALLFVGVFPANVQMAVSALKSERASTTTQVLTVARLPLQVPLVLWALTVRRRAARPVPA